VREAIEGGRHEVEVARMAQSHASDSKTKKFAEKLVKDHTAANNKLEKIASSHNITIPSETGSSRSGGDAKTTKERTSVNSGKDPKTNTPTSTHAGNGDLASLHGSDFDKAFAKQTVEDHQATIAKFESAQKDATNGDLKSFISSTLPTLREHLKEAQSLDK
jgi:putative membrane protein